MRAAAALFAALVVASLGVALAERPQIGSIIRYFDGCGHREVLTF